MASASIRVSLFAPLFLLCCLGAKAALAQEKVTPEVVNFTVPGVDGKDFTLSNYKGRWVIVNYWATWCGPCLREIPELNWFHNHYNDKAIVVGLNYEAIGIRGLKNFIAKHKINYPVVLMGVDPLPFEPLIGLPSTFFVSPDGEYVARHTGPMTARDLEKFIKSQ